MATGHGLLWRAMCDWDLMKGSRLIPEGWAWKEVLSYFVFMINSLSSIWCTSGFFPELVMSPNHVYWRNGQKSRSCRCNQIGLKQTYMCSNKWFPTLILHRISAAWRTRASLLFAWCLAWGQYYLAESYTKSAVRAEHVDDDNDNHQKEPD